MKKLCLFAILSMLCATAVNAQSLKVGAKAGLNVSSIYGDDADDLEPKVGFHIGGVVELPISDQFSVQPELLFSTLGAKSEFDNNVKLNFGYLSIPVVAKYYVIEGLSIEAGPQIGLLLSSKLKDDDDSVDFKDETKGFDFGLAVGAGYRMDNGLNFGVRFNPSFTNVLEDDNVNAKNIGFQISVGYFFM